MTSTGKKPSRIDTLCSQRVLGVFGESTVRRERAIERFCSEIGKNFSAEVRRISWKTALSPSFKAELQSLNLFSPSTLFLISQEEDATQAYDQPAVNIVTQAPMHNRFLITGKTLPTKCALRSYLEKEDALFMLEPFTPVQLKRWVEKELQDQGVTRFSPKVPDLLLTLAAGEVDRLAPLIERLSLLLDEGESATEQLVGQLSEATDEINDFALLELLFRKDQRGAELFLHSFFIQGKSPFALVGLLMKGASTIAHLQDGLQRGIHPSSLREFLGISPWVFNKQLESAKKLQPMLVRKVMNTILLAEAKLKNRSLGAELVLSEMVSRIVHS